MITLSFLIAGFVQYNIPSGSLQIIRLEQIYGFVAVALIYLALLISPLTIVFARIPRKREIIHTRRAIGVSGFYFATLHTLIAFFGQLGGFGGIKYLTATYQISLLLGSLALVILLYMALTSFDKIIAGMSYRRWKFTHRFIYLAGLMIIVHLALIGSHFIDVSPLGVVIYVAIGLLLALEALRIRLALKQWRTRQQ